VSERDLRVIAKHGYEGAAKSSERPRHAAAPPLARTIGYGITGLGAPLRFKVAALLGYEQAYATIPRDRSHTEIDALKSIFG
jgi:hypothetical protein